MYWLRKIGRTFNCKENIVMHNFYKSNPAILAKFQVLEKMRGALVRAEQEKKPEKYVERLALSVVAFEQKLLGK
jgi:hypothetical protein